MKVLHICLCGPVSDGWTYQENIITKYHKLMGLDVTIIASEYCWGEDGKLAKAQESNYINADGVKMLRLKIKGDKNFFYKFKKFENLYETIESENPDIIFVHGAAFSDVPQIVKYLKNNKNVIAYVDNHADLSNSGTNFISKNVLHKIIWRHYAKKLVPVTKKFYGVLPVRVDFLTDIYGLPKEKCRLLVMGADDEKVEKAKNEQSIKELRKKYGIKDTDFLVMTGGKIDSFKYQTLLLMEAVQKIESPNIKLIVFGSVEDALKEKVNALADGKKVQYIGWVKADDSYNYFAAADLVAFPGRHSVFWEQVAGQGIPMIVKSLPGTHHVDLGGNVMFLETDTALEIKEKLEELLLDPDKYSKMKEIAQNEGMKNFSYKNISARAIEQEI